MHALLQIFPPKKNHFSSEGVCFHRNVVTHTAANTMVPFKRRHSPSPPIPSRYPKRLRSTPAPVSSNRSAPSSILHRSTSLPSLGHQSTRLAEKGYFENLIEHASKLRQAGPSGYATNVPATIATRQFEAASGSSARLPLTSPRKTATNALETLRLSVRSRESIHKQSDKAERTIMKSPPDPSRPPENSAIHPTELLSLLENAAQALPEVPESVALLSSPSVSPDTCSLKSTALLPARKSSRLQTKRERAKTKTEEAKSPGTVRSRHHGREPSFLAKMSASANLSTSNTRHSTTTGPPKKDDLSSFSSHSGSGEYLLSYTFGQLDRGLQFDLGRRFSSSSTSSTSSVTSMLSWSPSSSLASSSSTSSSVSSSYSASTASKPEAEGLLRSYATMSTAATATTVPTLQTPLPPLPPPPPPPPLSQKRKNFLCRVCSKPFKSKRC